MTLTSAAALVALLTIVSLCGDVHAFSPPLPVLKTTPLKTQTTCTALSAISDEVTEEMKVAMKAKDTAALGTIRLIRGAFANAAIDLKTDKLTDEQAQTVLRKMQKMRMESIDMCEKGGATDRADAERAELAIIERWLPSLADEDQTRVWVKEAIDEAGVANVGKVMGALMKKHRAELDGKLAQRIVKEEMDAASS